MKDISEFLNTIAEIKKCVVHLFGTLENFILFTYSFISEKNVCKDTSQFSRFFAHDAPGQQQHPILIVKSSLK